MKNGSSIRVAVGLVLLLLSFLGGTCKAQTKPNGLDLLLKMTLFKEGLKMDMVVDEGLFQRFLKVTLKVDTLKSEGFAGYGFYSISPNFDANGLSYHDLPFITGNCDGYIVAVNQELREVYRLSGFYQNDFSSFLAGLQRMDYSDSKSTKELIKDGYIEGVDLKCLYKAFKANSFDVDKYPCLHYCGELANTHK